MEKMYGNKDVSKNTGKRGSSWRFFETASVIILVNVTLTEPEKSTY